MGQLAHTKGAYPGQRGYVALGTADACGGIRWLVENKTTIQRKLEIDAWLGDIVNQMDIDGLSKTSRKHNLHSMVGPRPIRNLAVRSGAETVRPHYWIVATQLRAWATGVSHELRLETPIYVHGRCNT